MLAWTGIGEGNSTWEVPETGWREGLLLLACFGRGGGEVIGDEPADTGKDSDFPEEALPQGEGGVGLKRRHKVRARGIRRYSSERVFGELGVFLPRPMK
jgi:hypothetical protein